jgi:hypothetical protein
LVEQVAVNHWVGGSSPSRGAKHTKGFKEILKIIEIPGAARVPHLKEKFPKIFISATFFLLKNKLAYEFVRE